MKSLFLLCLFGLSLQGFAQISVRVEVSADTVAPGEMVQLMYTIENGDGRFEPPDLTGVPVISGPNTSSSFLIENGRKSTSQTYSYILRPEMKGKISVPPAAFQTPEDKIMIDPIEITVQDAKDRHRPSPAETKTTGTTREKRKF